LIQQHRKAENQYAIAFMHARHSEVKFLRFSSFAGAIAAKCDTISSALVGEFNVSSARCLRSSFFLIRSSISPREVYFYFFIKGSCSSVGDSLLASLQFTRPNIDYESELERGRPGADVAMISFSQKSSLFSHSHTPSDFLPFP
jgi:hypothetical protein